MSKTQLQTNNSKLSALISELQGKVTSGSGGGSMETCVVTCEVSLPGFDPVEIYYIDGAGESQIADYLTVGTITVQKNSYLFINGWSASSGLSGDILRKFYDFGYALFYVTGDATLDFQT